MFTVNPLFAIDAYKLDHRRQYPEGTTRVYSNWTPRASRLPYVDRVVNFGLQAFLIDLNHAFEEFFDMTPGIVESAYRARLDRILGPNGIGTDHILALHDLGYVPLEFKALPEGTLTPLRVPMFTVENTVDEFFWLVNYLETWLSASLWLPSTSATTAYYLRKMLDGYADITGGPADFVGWQGHDFSFRGMSNVAAAAASGAGHLLSFNGSDTVPAFDWIDEYYGGDYISGSVAATEHSIMSAGGPIGERETFERLLDLYPTGIVSVVSDTWDLWNVIDNILPSLRDKIMSRESKLVIRPDSGDPVDILCGNPNAPAGSTERFGVIEALWNQFGGTVNTKGFKELDPHIGAIYGDSITYQRAGDICALLGAKGFASTNVVLGVGSFTYQYVTRDTFGFAMKATAAIVNDEERFLFKDPVTDSGLKKSLRGRIAVVDRGNGLEAIDGLNRDDKVLDDLLKTVYINGVMDRMQTFNNVQDTLWGEQ